MSDLTERLRKGRLVRTSQMMTCRLNGLPIEVATGEVRELCHPDALEAATTLETLTQENARLREALEGCEGIESGPNGRGGMRVVVHFPNGGDETALFHVLNSALAARKPLGGGDEQ